MEEEFKRDFATIGGVYNDGVSLIFDGEDEESDKHYLVNTACTYNAGDRVRIIETSGTYVVEYVVGTQGGGSGHGLPSGGTAGQSLVKTTNDDYDANWSTVHGIPSGGSSGYALTKSSSTDYAVGWSSVATFPSGGTNGQYLQKTSSATQWATITVPTGQTNNQYKVWALPTTGTTMSWSYPMCVYNSQNANAPIFFQVASNKLQFKVGPNGTWRDA